MKLTDQEITLFQSFNKSGTGKELDAFLQRKINDICDVRNMDIIDPAQVVGRKVAAQALQDIIDLIHSAGSPTKRPGTNAEYV